MKQESMQTVLIIIVVKKGLNAMEKFRIKTQPIFQTSSHMRKLRTTATFQR